MNAITPFTFEGRAVRTVERDGLPWFVAIDVCAVLGLGKHRDAISKLDADERGSVEVDTLGGRQAFAAVTESGLYALILRCRDAMTPGTPPHRFRKWVTAEVLPALRKVGRYGGGDPLAALDDPATMRGLLLGYADRVIAAEARACELEPKAAALSRIAEADGSMSITAAAKALQMGPRELHRWMRANGWTYRRPGSDRLLGFQAKVDAGLLEHKVGTIDQPGRLPHAYEQVLVTPKGLTRLAQALAQPARGLNHHRTMKGA
ncbi:phage antirepressor Ant [Sphingomonas sp. C8-2]|jgi:prophage antirepressor-like protein/phage antirepressor YoqD-like protein|nr:phage antirepressor Ant [Sphingomonas sp. C8-2]